MSAPSTRLAELGIDLPSVVPPAAAYIPAKQTGEVIYTSGQLPFVDGVMMGTGYLGKDVSVEDGYAMARRCALNAVAAAASVAGGVDNLKGVVKVVGFVASAEGFTNQPAVVNGASELLGEIFGDAGKHARSAIGMAELPFAAPVEVEVIFQL